MLPFFPENFPVSFFFCSGCCYDFTWKYVIMKQAHDATEAFTGNLSWVI